jgi:ribosomal protein S12 methylthiotransferase
MNSGGDSETYLSLIDTIRSELPNSAIRSTFLLGFPGEAEGDFRELADFIEEAELDWAGFFTYSREEGTAAFRYRARWGDLLSRRRHRGAWERCRVSRRRSRKSGWTVLSAIPWIS